MNYTYYTVVCRALRAKPRGEQWPIAVHYKVVIIPLQVYHISTFLT